MQDKISQLRKQIADLKLRMPAHSVKPAMLLELEELEEELEGLVKQVQLKKEVMLNDDK